MSAALNIGRYFVLSVVSFMAVGCIVILIVKLADTKPKPMMSETYRLVFWLSAAGVFAFLLGLVLVALPELGHLNFGVALTGGGFLALVGSTFLNAVVAKAKRAAWPVVSARCTERQLQMKAFWSDSGPVDGWLWRVVCEINYGGKHYVVSPRVHWSDSGQVDAPFWSEEKAHQFVSQRISSNGECKLRVNPNNPLEAELL
ncbi:MAG: hypothetical protein ABSA97_09685 [Verrucomicrobiia bacterium]|jgi:hypothetical protein